MQRSSQDILDIGGILYENSTSSLPITITDLKINVLWSVNVLKFQHFFLNSLDSKFEGFLSFK